MNTQVPTAGVILIKKYFQPGPEQLSFFDFITSRGGYCLPTYKNGVPACKDTPGNKITDRDGLRSKLDTGYTRFIHRPAAAGLLGYDLDKKNGLNGIAEFHRLTGRDPLEGFYVTTPSGGCHLYFFAGQRDYVSQQLPGGIDIKFKAFLTIPGSQSDRGQYTPQGYPYQIGTMPEAVARIVPIKKTPQPVQPPEPGQRLALDRIFDTLLKQGESYHLGQRNSFCFQLARFARKQGHDMSDVQRYLQFLISSDFQERELSTTIRSAYRGRQ